MISHDTNKMFKRKRHSAPTESSQKRALSKLCNNQCNMYLDTFVVLAISQKYGNY